MKKLTSYLIFSCFIIVCCNQDIKEKTQSLSKEKEINFTKLEFSEIYQSSNDLILEKWNNYNELSEYINQFNSSDYSLLIDNKNYRTERINYLISKFELDNLKDIKAKFLSGGQKKKLVIALSLLSEPKVLLLDECFAALDVLTIKMLQEIIVNLQNENKITICICDHQARDLLACVDIAMILSNGKIIAEDTPSNLVKNINAQNAYFGDNFKFN